MSTLGFQSQTRAYELLGYRSPLLRSLTLTTYFAMAQHDLLGKFSSPLQAVIRQQVEHAGATDTGRIPLPHVPFPCQTFTEMHCVCAPDELLVCANRHFQR